MNNAFWLDNTKNSISWHRLSDTTTRALAAADKVVSAVVMHAKLNIRKGQVLGNDMCELCITCSTTVLWGSEKFAPL